jgi:hypothetical protein
MSHTVVKNALRFVGQRVGNERQLRGGNAPAVSV